MVIEDIFTHLSFVCFVFSVFVTSIAGIWIISRLKKRHPDLYVQLGSPKIGGSNVGGSAWELQKFLWTFRFLKLHDFPLSFACCVALLGNLALAYIFFFPLRNNL
jgi:hypothetical protein